MVMTVMTSSLVSSCTTPSPKKVNETSESEAARKSPLVTSFQVVIRAPFNWVCKTAVASTFGLKANGLYCANSPTQGRNFCPRGKMPMATELTAVVRPFDSCSSNVSGRLISLLASSAVTRAAMHLQSNGGYSASVKTRERRGSSFHSSDLSQTTQVWQLSHSFLEESCRVKRSDTQTFSNYSKRVQSFQKRFPASPNKNVFSSNSQITYQTPIK